MKKVLLILMVLVTVSFSVNSFAEIEIKYDKFKNRTFVQIEPTRSVMAGTSIKPALDLVGWYEGQKPYKPKTCIIGFSAISPSWKYLSCHSVYCLADGKRVEMPPSKHHGEVLPNRVVFEIITILVPFSIVEGISKCENIQFKICDTEFSLSKYEMEDLKTFVGVFQKSN
jgi:hypothetical protein